MSSVTQVATRLAILSRYLKVVSVLTVLLLTVLSKGLLNKQYNSCHDVGSYVDVIAGY